MKSIKNPSLKPQNNSLAIIEVPKKKKRKWVYSVLVLLGIGAILGGSIGSSFLNHPKETSSIKKITPTKSTDTIPNKTNSSNPTHSVPDLPSITNATQTLTYYNPYDAINSSSYNITSTFDLKNADGYSTKVVLNASNVSVIQNSSSNSTINFSFDTSSFSTKAQWDSLNGSTLQVQVQFFKDNKWVTTINAPITFSEIDLNPNITNSADDTSNPTITFSNGAITSNNFDLGFNLPSNVGTNINYQFSTFSVTLNALDGNNIIPRDNKEMLNDYNFNQILTRWIASADESVPNFQLQVIAIYEINGSAVEFGANYLFNVNYVSSSSTPSLQQTLSNIQYTNPYSINASSYDLTANTYFNNLGDYTLKNVSYQMSGNTLSSSDISYSLNDSIVSFTFNTSDFTDSQWSSLNNTKLMATFTLSNGDGSISLTETFTFKQTSYIITLTPSSSINDLTYNSSSKTITPSDFTLTSSISEQANRWLQSVSWELINSKQDSASFEANSETTSGSTTIDMQNLIEAFNKLGDVVGSYTIKVIYQFSINGNISFSSYSSYSINITAPTITPTISSSPTEIYYYNPYQLTNNVFSYPINFTISVNDLNWNDYSSDNYSMTYSNLFNVTLQNSSTNNELSLTFSPMNNLTNAEYGDLNNFSIPLSINLVNNTTNQTITLTPTITLIEVSVIPTITNTLTSATNPTIVYDKTTRTITSNNFNMSYTLPQNFDKLSSLITTINEQWGIEYETSEGTYSSFYSVSTTNNTFALSDLERILKEFNGYEKFTKYSNQIKIMLKTTYEVWGNDYSVFSSAYPITISDSNSQASQTFSKTWYYLNPYLAQNFSLGMNNVFDSNVYENAIASIKAVNNYSVTASNTDSYDSGFDVSNYVYATIKNQQLEVSLNFNTLDIYELADINGLDLHIYIEVLLQNSSTQNITYNISLIEADVLPTIQNTLDASSNPTITYNETKNEITSNNFNLVGIISSQISNNYHITQYSWGYPNTPTNNTNDTLTAQALINTMSGFGNSSMNIYFGYAITYNSSTLWFYASQPYQLEWNVVS